MAALGLSPLETNSSGMRRVAVLGRECLGVEVAGVVMGGGACLVGVTNWASAFGCSPYTTIRAYANNLVGPLF